MPKSRILSVSWPCSLARNKFSGFRSRCKIESCVPFGPRRGVAGYITALSHEAPEDHDAKPLEDVVAGDAIPPALQQLLLWLADQYLAPVSSVLQTAMPRGTLSRVQRIVGLAVSEEAFRRQAEGFRGPAAELARVLLDNGGEASLARLQTAARKSASVLATMRLAPS